MEKTAKDRKNWRLLIEKAVRENLGKKTRKKTKVT